MNSPKESIQKTMLFSRIEGKKKYPNEIALRPSLVKLYDLVIQKLFSNDTTILITGETGAGKEVMAQIIHQESNRKDKPFVAVDISVGPETLIESELFGHEAGAFTGASHTRIGMLESANGGTVFLDEVGNISPYLQAKLLRTLADKSFRRVGGNKVIKSDFRLISATNMDLSEEVRNKRFRSDLYFRLSVMPIHIPPLRNHPIDIMKLSEFFMYKHFEKLNKKKLLYGGVIKEIFENYSWPGNVRELKNKIERLLILYDEGVPLDFILGMDTIAGYVNYDGIEDSEGKRVLKALIMANWNKTKAAVHYGCSRRQLYILMEKHGIPQKRPASLSSLTNKLG